MTQEITTISDLLQKIETYSCNAWVYLPSDEEWQLQSRAAVLKSQEVPQELEDVPGAGIPDFAEDNRLMQALPITEMQDIVQNARMQIADIGIEKLFEAFLYYYDNDSYIKLA